MQLSNSQYNEMAKDASAPSKSWFNIPKAFVIGGLICLIGQGILELYKATGFEKDEAAALTSLTLVLFSAVLTGLGLYPKVANHRICQFRGFAGNRVQNRGLGAWRGRKGVCNSRPGNFVRRYCKRYLWVDIFCCQSGDVGEASISEIGGVSFADFLFFIIVN